jgi:hypothetical protein
MYGGVANSDSDLTCYGILRKMQLYLSQVRTDLDSFNDAESYALMYSGYAQINFDYKRREVDDTSSERELEEIGRPLANWKFLQIKDYLTRPDKASQMEKVFKESSRVPFKLFYLSSTIKFMVLALAVAITGGLITLVIFKNLWDYSFINITVKLIVWVVILALIGVVSKVVATMLNIKSFIRKNIFFAIAMFLGWLVCNVYLWFFNGIYNDYGRLNDEKGPKKK